MKTVIAILFLLPCILFSQIKKADTANLPPPIQASAKNIYESQQKQKKLAAELDKELVKQLDIIREIRNEIARLKSVSKISENNRRQIKQSVARLDALKPEEYDSILNNPEVKWEQRPKSWFGRLFSKKKYRQFPYIIDEDSIIYIKRK